MRGPTLKGLRNAMRSIYQDGCKDALVGSRGSEGTHVCVMAICKRDHVFFKANAQVQAHLRLGSAMSRSHFSCGQRAECMMGDCFRCWTNLDLGLCSR